MSPFWVEYYCPREAACWQRILSPWPTVEAAARYADSLIWNYHSIRVADRYGNIVYSV